jgi:hypothetical protein
MKITSLVGALAVIAGLALFVPTTASAVEVGVAFGTPPPAVPVVVEHPWARPYAGAYWVRPHYELVNGGWVWVHGYYEYPPHVGAVWVPGHYRHGYWHPGHWS